MDTLYAAARFLRRMRGSRAVWYGRVRAIGSHT